MNKLYVVVLCFGGLGLLLPEFFSALSRGKTYFPVSCNILSAFCCAGIAYYFLS